MTSQRSGPSGVGPLAQASRPPTAQTKQRSQAIGALGAGKCANIAEYPNAHAQFLNRRIVTSRKPDPIDQRLVYALAHPLRISLLEALIAGPASPTILSGQLDIDLSNVSYHIEVLKKCGCIELERERPVRGAREHFYRIKPGAFVGNQQWRKVPVAVRGAVSGAALQGFMDVAVPAVEAGTLDSDGATLDWMPVPLDGRGQEEVARVMDAARKSVLAIHGKSKKRLAKSGESPTTYIIGFARFEAAAKPTEKSKRKNPDAKK